MFQAAFCARKYLEMELYLKHEKKFKGWFHPLKWNFMPKKSCSRVD